LLKGPFFVGGIDQKLPKNQKKCALWNFLEGWRNHREITTFSTSFSLLLEAPHLKANTTYIITALFIVGSLTLHCKGKNGTVKGSSVLSFFPNLLKLFFSSFPLFCLWTK